MHLSPLPWHIMETWRYLRNTTSSSGAHPVTRGSLFEEMARATAKRLSPRVAQDARVEDGNGASRPRSDYLERNREAWEKRALHGATVARGSWTSEELEWGLWTTPESELRLLEDVEPGADAIELGCGSGVVCAWLTRLGFRSVGVDFAPAQLKLASQLQRQWELSFPLVPANAEEVPFDDESFDVAISEYGASVWCNPRRWLPEAHRLLRPEGRLVFFTNSALLMACTPTDGSETTDRLVRSYFSTYRVEFPDEDAVEFHLTHGHWVRLLRASGFVLENLIEVRPPRGAQPRFEFVSTEWARRWPSEEIWVARKVSVPKSVGTANA